jgi:hypothetical protein
LFVENRATFHKYLTYTKHKAPSENLANPKTLELGNQHAPQCESGIVAGSADGSKPVGTESGILKASAIAGAGGQRART